MFLQDIKIFVDVVTLSPSNVESKALDWRGDRGFFDECTWIARWRGLEDGFFQWTGALIEDEDTMTDRLNQSHEGSFDEDGELGLIVKVIPDSRSEGEGRGFCRTRTRENPLYSRI